MDITQVSSNKSFGGDQKVFSHQSKVLACPMKFAIYLPPNCSAENKCPVVYWLSGLTCDENNFIQKSGAQKYAAELGLIIVCPDTSPRNIDIPGQDDSYDFGSGAGFYVDATTDPWKNHYKMYSYVTSELIDIISANFPILPGKQSISGHSMGGHGALTLALRNPGLYKSVTAFAPICNPMKCPWGTKAFQGYLGSDTETWKDYDATELVGKYAGPPLELFIDQGSADNFFDQLLPKNFIEACAKVNVPCIAKSRPDYDHSYFYIASFIGEHLAHHSKFLK